MKSPAPIIIDLCGGTGSWSDPYRRAGYDVRVITLPTLDVRDYDPPARVHGILAAPPCTQFAVSGARWWATKPSHLIAEGLSVVHACLRIIRKSKSHLQWWALENPVGRLPRYIGPYGYTFQPWEYGDPWFKRTCIWGTAVQPQARVRHAPARSPQTEWVHHLPPSADRATLRSVTPPAFARAFFEANP